MSTIIRPQTNVNEMSVISVRASSTRNHHYLNYSIKLDAYSRFKLVRHLRSANLNALECALQDFENKVGVKSTSRTFRQNLNQIILNLFVAWSAIGNPFLAVPLGRTAYAPGTRLRTLRFKFSSVTNIISILKQRRLIEFHSGFYNRDRKEGRCTRIRADGDLVEMFIEYKMLISSLIKENPLIILRDEKKNEINISRGRHAAESKKFLPTLNKINSILTETEIKLDLCEDEFIQNFVQPCDGRKEPCIAPNPCANTLHRVFNLDFNHGGRFYGTWWQGIPRKLRSKLSINGLQTVELDYKSLHPRLLYLREKIALEHDPYLIPSYGPSFRPIFKLLLNCAINAASPSLAKAAVRKAIADTPRLLKDFHVCLSDAWLSPAWEALVQNHSPIAKHLGSGAGLSLQRIDSDMAEHVMLSMISQNIPVLCVHDSFLVANIHEHALESAMQEAALAYAGGNVPTANKTPQNSLLLAKAHNFSMLRMKTA